MPRFRSYEDLDAYEETALMAYYTGRSVEWIEEELMVSRNTLYRIMRAYGLDKKRGNYESREEEQFEAVRMHKEDGLTIKQCSEMPDVEVTRQTIRKYYRQIDNNKSPRRKLIESSRRGNPSLKR